MELLRTRFIIQSNPDSFKEMESNFKSRGLEVRNILNLEVHIDWNWKLEVFKAFKCSAKHLVLGYRGVMDITF